MKTTVTLQQPGSGEVKRVKVGWSWDLFLFAGFFGVPLFMRRLHAWGAFALLLCASSLLLELFLPGAASAFFVPGPNVLVRPDEVLQFTVLGMHAALGVQGNELTAKAYLKRGWAFADPDSPEAQLARKRWRLA